MVLMFVGVLVVLKMGWICFCVREYHGGHKKGHITAKRTGISTQQPTVYLAWVITARGGVWWGRVRCSCGATGKGNVAGLKIPLSGCSVEGSSGSSFMCDVSCQNNAHVERQTDAPDT
jgi:hypothetical protein